MWSGISSVGSATRPSGKSGKSRTSATSLSLRPRLVRTDHVSTTALVWFRRDLRVHDHPALTAAQRECDRVMPVFVLDRRLLGGRFPSANRAWFLQGCLAELREALRERGADLVIREGRPEEELPALARECGAEAVYFAGDVSPFARARGRRVAEVLDARPQPGLFIVDDLGALKPYSVF